MTDITREPITPWGDPHVQIVYELLCDFKAPNNPEEHWEGWIARRIIDALRAIEPAPCETCNDDPEVCSTVPGLRHCEAAMREPAPDAAPTPEHRMDNLWRINLDPSVNNFARSICGEAANYILVIERELADASKSTLFYIEERAHYKTRAEAAEHLLQRALIALQVCNEIKAALATGGKDA